MYNFESDDDTCSVSSCLKESLNLNNLKDGCIFEISKFECDDLEDLESHCSKEDIDQYSSELYSAEDEITEGSFQDLAKKFHSLTDDNGVLKNILKPGNGVTIPPESNVTVHYNAYLEYSDEPFDSTRLRKKVHTFNIGLGENILGFDIAVSSMKKNELSRFIINYDYAYGEYGCPPRIPPQAICMYVIEVLDFKTPNTSTDLYFCLPMRERTIADFEVMMTAFKNIKKKAKGYFSKDKFNDACHHFRKAFSILEEHHLKDEAEEIKIKPFLLEIELNIALCNLKLCQSGRTITHTNNVLRVDPTNVKALYFKGKALKQLGKFEEAKMFLLKAIKFKPNNKDILKEIKEVEDKQKLFEIVTSDTSSTNLNSPSADKQLEKLTNGARIHYDEQTSISLNNEDIDKKYDKILNELSLLLKDQGLTNCLISSNDLNPEQYKEIKLFSLNKGLQVSEKSLPGETQMNIFKK